MATTRRARYDLVMGEETGADLFAIADLAGHDLPDGNVIARNRRTGAQMPLPGEVFNAITYCDAFRTLEGQAAHLAGPNARGREGEIRQILQSVIQGGLMVSAASIAARLQPDGTQAEVAHPKVAVLTCDRPEALGRLLNSMVEAADFEHIDSVVVVDDSREESSLAANRAAIESASARLQARSFRPIRHFTPGDASTLLEQLVQHIPQHESAIRFLLDRRERGPYVTTGISRNLAQLLAVGRPLLVFDDDVLCQVYNPPMPGAGVEFSSRQRDCRFFASEQDWPDSQPGDRPCPVSRHMEVLGRTLPESLSVVHGAAPPASAFEHAPPFFAQRLSENSRVLVSQSGSIGDPGSGSAVWVALLPVDVSASLFEIAGDLGQSVQPRNCWLGRSQTVFEPRAVMSQLTGLDNSQFLPPYFPLHRGQDKIFGAMVEFLHPDGVTADLPFAIPHLPIPARAWSEGQQAFQLPFTLGHYMHDHVTSLIQACSASDPLLRSQWLSQEFLSLANAPRERLVDGAADHWTQQRIDWLKHLSQALGQCSDGPAAQVRFLQNSIRELQTCNIRDFHHEPLSGPNGMQGEPVLDYWRDAWGHFAAGLRAWPAIREAAATLD